MEIYSVFGKAPRLIPWGCAGTLTLNQLSVDRSSIMVLGGKTIEDCLKTAALSANIVSEEPIDVVLHESYDGASHHPRRKQFRLLLDVVDVGCAQFLLMASHANHGYQVWE